MAVGVAEKKDPIAKFGSQVDEQIAQATGRIRAHDLTLGALTLAALVAVYATAMIVCDRYFILAEWVRQLSLGVFALTLCGVGYFLIIRPLRKQINPLYAAARVEKTIDDPKNSVTGYVEVQEKGEVHTAIKAAMSAKAAKAVHEADVNRAVDHRSLIVAGGVLILFLLTLAVLFFVFRPGQFSSLISRAFVPFSSSPIATRTQLLLLKPEPVEPTITTGQTITVAVHVSGKVPAKHAPDRVRLLIRHNQADPNFEEIAMNEGESSRDWQVKVPDYLVQNGFWYKVAAGDTETPEYRVTVRTLPMFTDYESSYEYPAYTRKPSDKATGPNLRAYKGTKITLIGKTNREVTEGLMKFDAPGLQPVVGKPVPNRPDSLEFKFTATAPTGYKLYLTTPTGERNTDAPAFTLAIDSDNAPTVIVTKPEEPETTAPANGQLVVDGTVGDDFGIDKVRLRMRFDGRDLAPVPYMNGQSFLRKKDNTWPTDLTFKLSADLTKLTFADGAKFVPQFGTEKPVVIEFWVEAIDNCSEAKPVPDWSNQVGNVGRSITQTLRLTPPETTEEKQQDLADQKQQRANEEKQHNQQQQDQLNKEERKKPEPQAGKEPQKKDDAMPPPKAEQDPDGKKEKEKEKEKAGTGGEMSEPKSQPKQDSAKKSDDAKSDGKGMPESGMKTPPDMNPPKDEKKGGGMPPEKGMNQTDPNTTGGTGMEQPQTAPMPKTPEDKQLEQNADRVKQELEKSKDPMSGSSAKPNANANAEENRTDPADSKPQPPPDGMGMEPQSKPKPKANDPDTKQPMGGANNEPSERRPEGKIEEKTDPDAQQKPGPQQPKEPNPKEPNPKEPMKKSAEPSETRNEPLGGTPGHDKPEPKDSPKPQPGDKSQQSRDEKSGATGKPSTEQPEPKEGDPTENAKRDPTANVGQPKPNRDPMRGEDRDPAQAKASPGGEQDPKSNPMAGDAKPQQAPPSGEAKPKPKNDEMAGKQPDATEAKPAPDKDDPKGANASEARPDEPKKPPMPGNKAEKSIDRGEDRPATPEQRAGDGSTAPDPKMKEVAKGGKGTKDGKSRKPSEEELKDLENAVKDLQNPDEGRRKEAQEKLDKAIGPDNRKELEQLQKDLQSPDEATRKAAEKKIEDLKQQAKKEAGKDGSDEKPKGKQLSPEEIAELAKKANDLNSKDEQKRQAAEKELDDKIGKEAREQLQEEMKKQAGEGTDPKGPDELKRKIDEIAKKTAGAGKGPIDKHANTPGASSEPPLPAMDDDPRNRAKTAQLQLEEFEKNRYNRDLLEKLGWTEDEYQKFLNDYAKRVEGLQREADAHEEALRTKPKSPIDNPAFNTGSAGKVESRDSGSKIEGKRDGTLVAPPGFGDALRKFQAKPKQ